jgi:PAS domain S-box-containing protein
MGNTRSVSVRHGRFWREILAASLGLTVTLLGWQAARTAEKTHIRRMTHLAASAIKEDLSNDTETWRLNLIRLAELWDSPDGPTFSEWKTNAALYIQHHSGCVAVEWIQPSYEERWLVQAPGEGAGGPAFDEAQKRFLQAGSALSGPFSTPVFDGKNGLKQRLIVVPVSRNNKFEGFVIALIDVQRSTDVMFTDVMSLGYSILIREAGTEIYRLPGSDLGTEKQWGESAEFHLPGGVVWNLSIWPRPSVLSELASSLPQTILLAGGLLSLLLTVTVGLARFSHAKSVRLKSANADLEASAGEQRRAEAALRSSEARLAGILDISADAVISVNQQMQIILFNQGAERIFGYNHEEILGRNLDILIPERYRSNHSQHVSEFGRSGQRTMLMCGRKAVFGLRKDGTEFPMEVSLARLDNNGDTVYTAIARDVTERLRVQEELARSRDELELRVQERTAALRELASHVVKLEDEERRRIARELHDGTTQSLVALSAELTGLEKTLHDPDATVVRKVRYSRELVKQSLDEIRTVSYLLHPPLLDELGLDTALRGYVEGFSARSEIQVSLHLPPDLGELSRDLQLAIFRVVQESLANVHRHSGSRSASIHLTMTPDQLTLEIADQGRGMSSVLPISRAGVGINSMRERIRQLGGRCEIESSGRGTTVRAILPATRPKSLTESAPPNPRMLA